MTGLRHMALWLAAVIVLIAVGLMPSDAQAHAGHPHAARVAATALPPTASSEARTGEAQTLLSPLAIRTVVVLAAPPVRALSTGTCDGTCCNAGCRNGSCCTGAGLTPDIDADGDPRGPGDRALARALPARTDVVPEALPEPPRS
ncbi:hypothetical protein [Methylobacterium goesingense]|uniref:Secreted protein n=1 Tax=Methylobacterium goesingense TaxID=243690 RepID=A0ABV2L976_9HYPH|nr:hypothetical protein [Methylobacterium goesingense]GJD76215.1 hypothetical protein CFIICLFH_4465 [Methylobacterium goesingense]